MLKVAHDFKQGICCLIIRICLQKLEKFHHHLKILLKINIYWVTFMKKLWKIKKFDESIYPGVYIGLLISWICHPIYKDSLILGNTFSIISSLISFFINFIFNKKKTKCLLYYDHGVAIKEVYLYYHYLNKCARSKN